MNNANTTLDDILLDKEIEEKLYEFRDKVIQISKMYNYHGQDCVHDPSWIIESAILFSMALLTTIGYGHVVPTTWEGQVVCICFSIIGSPFFFICVANLSFTLGDLFRVVYGKFINCMRCKLCSSKKTSSSSDELNEEISDEIKHFIRSKEDNNLLKQLQMEEKNKVTVPIFVAVSVIFLYIMIGAVLFHHLENWSYIQASYFSFIAIATIGFGDLVPGLKALHDNDMADGKAERNILIAAIYLFFGIILIAMCFDLIEEQLKVKVKRFKEIVVSIMDGSCRDRYEYVEEIEYLNESESSNSVSKEINETKEKSKLN